MLIRVKKLPKGLPSLQGSQAVGSTGCFTQTSLTAPLENKNTPGSAVFKMQTIGREKTKQNNLLFPNIYGLAPRESPCPQKRLSAQG